MRTTVTLAADVAAAVERVRRERGIGVSEAVNELVRRGLTRSPRSTPFSQRRRSLGAPSLPLDDVAAVLDALEGDGRRS